MSTGAERLEHRDHMRARRAGRAAGKTDLEQGGGWSFENICRTVGLSPSAQSSLNAEHWRGFVSPYEGLGIRQIRGRVGNDRAYLTNAHLFAKAA